jgi:predicted amidophosphoribosyltransferase
MVKFQARTIIGAWRSGYALDLHTISSTYMGDDEFGHPRFDTQRSEIGDLLYQLKYNGDRTTVEKIAEAAESFIRHWKPGIDLLVPVPPSTVRTAPPVVLVAQSLSKRLGLPLVDCVKLTRDVQQLKDITDLDERLKLLEGLHAVDKAAANGKRILLFDDLYRSGATLNAISKALYDSGGAQEVFALTITRTRSNR